MEISKVNFADKLNTFGEHWSPKVFGELNNQYVKVAKLKRAFPMRHHEHEDELFYMISGEPFIELQAKTLHLKAGEFVIIPKGVDHKPTLQKKVM